MKTKNFKKILTLAVSALYALVGLVTGGLFFATPASATTNVLDAIQGYGVIKNGEYSYLYFGEYPQRRVLEVTNGTAEGKTGWETFPTYCPDSVYVEETIKGYIAELNEQYYNKYLPSVGSGEIYDAVSAHLTQANTANSTTTTLGTYDWETSTIYTFYPQQNFETKNLYFDYDSGYYTLKTNVVYPNSAVNKTPGTIAYAAGTKFHTYNHVVDSLSKYSGYTTTGSTDVVYSANYNNLTPTTATTGGTRTNVGSWGMNIGGTDTVSYNTAKSGETFLYVVEPIKWRVLSRDGNNALIVSETILDSIRFDINTNYYENEWKYSYIRTWLNNSVEQGYFPTQTGLVNYQPALRNFMNMAFNEDEQSAINTTQITQDSPRSYYGGSWHYYVDHPAEDTELYNTYSGYTGTNAWDFNAPIEDKSITTTNDKIFFLSYDDVSNDPTLSAKYGFTSNTSRIAYNTDYALATGNYDYKLAEINENSTNYSQNTTSSNGGYWWLRSSFPTFYSYARNVYSYGTISLNTVINSLGVRPALILNLDNLNTASVGTGSKGWQAVANPAVPALGADGTSTNAGTLNNPIALDYASQTASGATINASVVYSMGEQIYASIPGELVAGTDAQSIASTKGGSWQVESTTKIDSGANAGKYSHIIKVNYNDQVAGSYLVARVVNTSNGTNLAMAPITSVLVNNSTPDENTSTYFVSGTTYFQIITNSASASYKVIVYASQNGELQSAGIYPHLDGNLNSAEISTILQNYTDNGNAYDYVYFGEYPKTSVAKKITSSSATDGYNGGTTYGTFTTDSVNISNTILGLIDALNDSYYNTYLKAQTESAIYKNLVAEKGSYPYATTAYNWLSSTANSQGIYINDADLTVEFFYPLEDYENSNLFFDYETGYYTLKADYTSGAITYYAGSKFHVYNNTVDVYQKYGMYSAIKADGTLDVQKGYDASNTSKVYRTNTLSLSNITNWNANLNGDGVNVSYNPYVAGSSYLFVVEPIKWRVLEVNGSEITVLSDDLIDSVKFNQTSSYGNEWQYSEARAWLNGIDEGKLYNSTTDHMHYLYDRSFLDMAFSPELQSAIVEKTHSQDNYRSYYDGKWHYYNADNYNTDYEAAADKDAFVAGNVLEKSKPTTTDKVWFLSEDEAFGDTALGINAYGGLKSGGNNIAYNSDYSIFTGNYDNALNSAASSWQHNTRGNVDNYSGNYGGLWWLRSSYPASTYNARLVDNFGTITYTYVGSSLGVRPALILNLDNLNIASVTSESGQSAYVPGTSENPINASEQLALGISTNGFYIFSTNAQAAGSTTTSGSWQVMSVEPSATEGLYTHKIQVDFAGLYNNYAYVYANQTLNAKISDKNGKDIAFATIASNVNGTSGTTFFTFDAPTNNTSDYIIEIYVAINGQMTSSGIYEKSANGTIGATGTIWLDPVLGNDLNTGLREAYPIATLDRAMQIAGNNAVVMLKNTIYITKDTTIDFDDRNVTIMRYYAGPDDYFAGNMFEVGIWDDALTQEQNNANRITLTLNNVTVNGSGIGRYCLSAFKIVNANVVVNDGFSAVSNYTNKVKAASNEESSSGGLFYITNSDITINGGYFYLNYAITINTRGSWGGVICAKGNSNIVVNGGEFRNNLAYGGGVIYASGIVSIKINGGYFNNPNDTYAGTGMFLIENIEKVDIANAVIENCKFLGNSGTFYIRNCIAVDISNCKFINNQVGNSGGAIVLTSVSSAKIYECEFSNNKANDGNGGAIYATDSDLELVGCTFENNTANSGGGAVYITNGNLRVEDCEFSECTATRSANGGAIYSTVTELKVINTKFIKNKSGGNVTGGGAIRVTSDCSNVYIENCDFIENSSSGNGGAIAISAQNTNNIINCQFINNHGGYSSGGAIYCNATLFVDGGLFKGNSAPKTGGAISGVYTLGIFNNENYKTASNLFYHSGASPQATIKNAIFEGNYVTDTSVSGGGAVCLSGNDKPDSIDNCIFKNNSALVGGAVIAGAATNAANGTLTITNSVFEGNSANGSFEYVTNSGLEQPVYSTSGGGAVAMLGATLTVDNCNFNDNSATDNTNGGAIVTSATCANVSVTNSNFVGNNANYGGAVYVNNVDGDGSVNQFINCYFGENTSRFSGGAIVLNGFTRITDNLYENCSFIANGSGGDGGAVYIRGGTIDGCYFSYNTAQQGGAIYVRNATGVYNSIIEYNKAAISGSSALGIYSNTVIKNNFLGDGEDVVNVLLYINSSSIAGENIYIYNNFANLTDSDGNLIIDPQDLLLDENGDIIPSDGAYQANVCYGPDTQSISIYSVFDSTIGLYVRPEKFVDDLQLSRGKGSEFIDPNCFILDNAESLGAELYYKDGNLYVGLINQGGSAINYTASDYVGVYDNEYHTIDVNVFGLNNYTVVYGLTTDADGKPVYDLTEAPTFKDVTLKNGSTTIEAKTVYFKITSSGKTAVEDSRKVKIDKATSLTQYGNPVMTVWAGLTINDYGRNETALNDYISGFCLKDTLGDVVPGKIYFEMVDAQFTFNINNLNELGSSNSACFVFVPDNPNYGLWSPLIKNVNITFAISYDNLWYLNGVYYPEDPNTVWTDGKKLSDSASTYPYKVTDGQNGADLNTMISFVKDGGTLYLGSTYTIASGKTFNLSVDNELTITRYSTREALFDIKQNGKLDLNVADNAKLKIIGGYSTGKNHSLIYNSGKLNISGYVEFSHNSVKDYDTLTNQGNGSVLYNFATGEAMLDGCKFVHDNGKGIILAAINGGVVYNLGSLTIKNCETIALGGNTLYALGAGGTIYSAGMLKIYDSKLASGLRGDSNVGGGVIYVAENSSAEIYNTYVSGSAQYSADTMQSTSRGGGLFIGAGATAYLEDCEITNNKAYSGGGIYVEGSTNGVGGSLTLVRTKVDNNSLINNSTVGYGNGGGIYAGENTTIVINGGSVSGNLAYSYNETTPANSWEYKSNCGLGGGIYILNSTLEISGGAKLDSNKSAGGGAIYSKYCNIELSNCLISNNYVKYYYTTDVGDGAAIWALDCILEINSGSEFVGNNGYAGAIIYLNSNTKSVVNINNVKIYNNIVRTLGLISVFGANSTLNIYNCEIVDNSVNDAVIYAKSGTINMYGGMVSRNIVNSGRAVYLRTGVFNMYGGEITYNDRVGVSSAGGAIYLDEGSKFVLDGGDILYNNASGTSGKGSNIYIVDTASALTIKSGRVLSAHNNPANSAYGKDIYFPGATDGTSPDQLFLYGGEVDSIYIAGRIEEVPISGKIIVNNKITMKPWNGGVDTEGLSLKLVGDLLPGTRINIQALSRNNEGISYPVLSRSSEWEGYSDAKMKLYKNYFTFYNFEGIKMPIENFTGTAASGNFSYLRCFEVQTNSVKYIYFNPVSGNDSKDGTSEANALQTWEAVIAKAEELEIKEVYLTSTWALSNGDNINGKGLTLIRHSSLNNANMFSVESGVTATLDNFVLNGNSVSSSVAMINNLGTLTIKNSTLQSAVNTTNGGAIYNEGALTVKNSTFEANSANYGGAIYSGGGSTLTVENSKFDFNEANVRGGAIELNSKKADANEYVECNGVVTNSTFNNNKVSGTSADEIMGGAICSKGNVYGGVAICANITISGCEFNNNSATNSDKTKQYHYGGAVVLYYGDDTVTNSKFVNNTALIRGAAIYSGGAHVNVDSCEFVNNKCDATINCYGGAIYHQDNQYLSGLEVTNSNFVGNYANMHGAELYINAGSSVDKVLINNCSFSDNLKVVGSLLYFETNPANVTVNDEVPAGTEPDYNVEVTNCSFENIKVYDCVIQNICTNTRFKFENLTFANIQGQQCLRYESSQNSTNKALHKNIKMVDCNFTSCALGFSARASQVSKAEVVFDGLDIKNCVGTVFNLNPYANASYILNNVRAEISSGFGLVCSLSTVTSVQSNLNISISNCYFDGLNRNTSSLIFISTADNIQIKNCYIQNNNTVGISIRKSKNLIMDNCYLTNCNSGSEGGGVYITDCSASINNCYFTNNSTTGYGGAVYGGGTFNNCYFINNSATGSNGGGAVYGGGTFNSCYFENNTTASVGGSYYCGGGAISGGVTANNCTFKNNYSPRGGAIDCTGASVITNCYFEGNYGGHTIYSYYSNVTIDNCFFVKEKSNVVIWTGYNNNQTLKVLNSTFTQNENQYLLSSAVKTIIDGCVFEGNNEITNLIYLNNIAGKEILNSKFNNNISTMSFINNVGAYAVLFENTVFNANTCTSVIIGKALITSSNFANNIVSYENYGLIYSADGFEVYDSNFYGNISTKSAMIQCYTARYLFTRCNFYDNYVNSSSVNGGLFKVTNKAGELILDECKFSNNTYLNSSENVVYQNSIYVVNGYLYMRNCEISNKNSTGYNASTDGVVYISANAEPCVMVGCVVENGDFGSSSAIVNKGTLSITDMRAYGNTADNGSVISNYGILNIAGENTLFSGNLATNKGGAIYNNNGARLTITEGAFSGNTANLGGVIYNDLGANLVIANGTFSGNTAQASADGTISGNGGAIYNLGTLTINDALFTENFAENGGGLYNLGSTTINNGVFNKNYITVGGGAIYNATETLTEADGTTQTTYVGNLIVNYADFRENTPVYVSAEINDAADSPNTYGYGIANGGNLTVRDGYFYQNHRYTNVANNVKGLGGSIYVKTGAIANIFGGEFICNNTIGGAVYADEGSFVNITNSSIQIYGSQTQIYVNNAHVQISNCFFSSYSGETSVYYLSVIYLTGYNNDVIIKDCEFFNLKVRMTIISLEKTNNIIIDGCKLYDNIYTNGNSNLISVNQCSVSGLKILIKNSIFENNASSVNSSSLIRNYNGDRLIIQDCLFKDNVILRQTNSGSTFYSCIIQSSWAPLDMINNSFVNNVVTNGNICEVDNRTVKNKVVDCEFKGNFAKNMLYVGGETYYSDINLYGENVITNNKVVNYALGYTASDEYKIEIGNGGRLIVEDNFLCDPDGNYLDASGNVTADPSKYVQRNISIPYSSQKKLGLFGGLAEGSRVGINIYLTETGASLYHEFIAITPKDASMPITTSDFECFFYDNNEYGLALRGGNIVLVKPSEISGDKVYVNNKVYLVDGEYKGFDKADIEVYKNSVKVTDFDVLYADSEADATANKYSTECPQYASLGDYTIWYKIVDSTGADLTKSDGSVYSGTLSLKIVKNILTLVENPIARISKGETLSTATFVGGKVMSNGYEVAGTWAFEQLDTIPTDNTTKYSVKFTAASSGIYSNSVSTSIAVEWLFDSVDYKVVSGVNDGKPGFFVGTTFTGITLLSEIMQYMANNGVINIYTTYVFVEDEVVSANTAVRIYRNSALGTGNWFEISNETDISVTIGGGIGKIVFDGVSTSTYSKLLCINENTTFTFGANVEVINLRMSNDNGEIIKNLGTLNINGASFINNMGGYAINSDAKGGLIYSTGNIYINSGLFINNSTQSDNKLSLGGVIYNDGGSVVISGGTFSNNVARYGYCGYGGVIYNNGGSVDICGGVFSKNSAAYGGVVANKGGKVVFSGGTMLFNSAVVKGAVIYNDETNANQSLWGEVIYNGSEMLKNSLLSNGEVDSVVLVNNVNWWAIVSIVLSVALIGVFAGFVLHKQLKGKRS